MEQANKGDKRPLQQKFKPLKKKIKKHTKKLKDILCLKICRLNI